MQLAVDYTCSSVSRRSAAVRVCHDAATLFLSQFRCLPAVHNSRCRCVLALAFVPLILFSLALHRNAGQELYRYESFGRLSWYLYARNQLNNIIYDAMAKILSFTKGGSVGKHVPAIVLCHAKFNQS